MLRLIGCVGLVTACGPPIEPWVPLFGAQPVDIAPARGLGILIHPGESHTVYADVAANSALRFFEAGTATGVEATEEPIVTFEILMDGAEIWSHKRRLGESWDHWVEAVLPSESRRRARFEFRVHGQPVSAGFLCPTLGPVGSVPASGSQNIIFFVAQGLPSSAEARNFPGLPGECSVFSNVHIEDTFVDALEPLLETLGSAGYRTGAVVEELPSEAHRNFEWYFPRPATTGSPIVTLKRALEFLARGDGRPSALLLHTRLPSTASEATLLGMKGDVSEWWTNMQPYAPSSQTVFVFVTVAEGGLGTIRIHAPDLAAIAGEPCTSLQGLSELCLDLIGLPASEMR